MLNILFITTAFPPHPESQTIRNAYLIRSLIENGHQVTVVTKPTSSKPDTSTNKLIKGTEIHNTDLSPFDKIQERIGKLPLGHLLKWLHGIYCNLFIIPDPHKGWDSLAINLVDRLSSSRKFDVIISSSGSYTAHLAGRTIANRHQIPLILELGDPWTHNPIWPANLPYRKAANQNLERICLEQSSGIIVTTQETRDSYESHFRYTPSRIAVVPMGYAEEDFNSSPPKAKPLNSQITLTYAGVAYKRSRNLIPIFDGIHLSSSINFACEIFGHYSTAFIKHCSKRDYSFVNFNGQVSYTESILHITNSDILILIGNRGGVQIPGKVYMYIATQVPILYLAQTTEKRDPTWQLMKSLPGIIRCTNEKHNIHKELTRIAYNLDELKDAAKQRSISNAVRSFEWREVGNSFCTNIENLINAKTNS